MKKLLMLFTLVFFSIFLLSNISATTFKQSSDVTFTVSCEFVNCSDGSVLLTVIDPSGNTIIDNQTMNVSTGYVSYKLNTTDIAIVGVYPFYITTNNSYYSNSFKVTPNGEDSTTATAVFYIGLLALLVIFFVMILVYGLDTENIVGKTFSVGFGYLFLIGIFFIAWQMALAFIYSSPFLIDFLRIGFFVLIIGFFPLLIILFAYGVYMMLQIKEIKDMQERGISIDEINDRKGGGRY